MKRRGFFSMLLSVVTIVSIPIVKTVKAFRSYFHSDGTFCIGTDENNYIAWDGTNLTFPIPQGGISIDDWKNWIKERR